MKTRKPQAVVFVSGGVVQGVVINDPSMKVIVVDFDTDGQCEKGMKKNRSGEPCNYGVWSDKMEGVLDQKEVRYWSDKDRVRKPKAKRIGFCEKCSHRIVKHHKKTKEDGSCPIVWDEFIGCDIEGDPKMGDDCPLTREKK